MLGAISLVALLWVRRRPLPRALTVTVLPIVLLVSGLMAYTANLGGQIRHTEIRGGAVGALTDGAGDEREYGKRER